jgi:hypothetical protein
LSLPSAVTAFQSWSFPKRQVSAEIIDIADSTTVIAIAIIRILYLSISIPRQFFFISKVIGKSLSIIPIPKTIANPLFKI